MFDVLFAALVEASSHVSAPKATCNNEVVAAIRAAGWKGHDQKVAYAVSWRESNGNPGAVGAGSYGLFQIQDVWSGTRFWPADPLDAVSNAKAAHRMWRSFSWRPWGINATGDGVDRRDYMGWSEDQVFAWIWAPYAVGLKKYDRLPKGCR